MTEYFRIEGLNTIAFDTIPVSDTLPVYNLVQGSPPRDLSDPMTRQEVIQQLPRLPLGVRGHALNRGMSMVRFSFDIQAGSDAAVEQALHDLKETLNEAQLWIESQGQRGTRTALRYSLPNAVESSYKTIYYGYLEEAGSRDVLGAKAKEQFIDRAMLTLYMEPMWRPSAAIELGPNEVYCPGFEEDGDANGRADDWTARGAPVLTIVSDPALQGFYSQRVDSNAIAEGLNSTTVVAPALETDAVAYVWVRRPAAGSDIRARIEDTTAPATRAQADYSGATVTAVDRNGDTWRRLDCIANGNIVAGNNHQLQVYSLAVDVTTFYVDKAYLKWGVVVIPDEWCDHWLLYNHYDTTEGAAHEGHINYFDTADLKGTDEARLLIQIELEQAADEARWGDLLVARRNWWEWTRATTSDNHWLEAEDAQALTNWGAGALARCSAGSRITNAANVTGSALFQFFEVPVGAQYNANAIKGRYDVFGMVYTNDEVNTQYRLSYSNFSGLSYFYNQWVKQPNDLQWQMLYLGEVNFDKFIRDDLEVAFCYIEVEYEKDAADTVEMDCIWLLSKTDPETRLHTVADDWLGTAGQYWTIDRTEDFDYEEKEYYPVITLTTRGELCLQGDVMTLTPNRIDGQRLYFCCESVDTTPSPDERTWEAHGAATDLQMIVTISYLPQYQTPLD